MPDMSKTTTTSETVTTSRTAVIGAALVASSLIMALQTAGLREAPLVDNRIEFLTKALDTTPRNRAQRRKSSGKNKTGPGSWKSRR
jgi:hypothetical protein